MQTTIATGKVWEAKDFDPYHVEEPKPVPVGTLLKYIEEANSAFGGVDLRGRKKIDA